jgi:GT2 family glycosyltransferase
MSADRGNAILVLGMHRSGTSALARVFSLLGAGLPNEILPPNEFNPSGYWEPTAVVDLNDAWLSQAEAAWDAPFLSDEARQGSLPRRAIADAATTIHEAYKPSDRWIVLKDPRCTLFAPTWRAGLVRAGYEPKQVVIRRDVSSVAHSLASRDGFKPDEAGLLWAWYGVRALQAVAEAGGAVIDYEQLTGDWRSCLKALASQLKLRSFTTKALEQHGAEIDEFLKPSAIRPRAEFSAEVGELVEVVEAAYQSAMTGERPEGLDDIAQALVTVGDLSRQATRRVRIFDQSRLDEVVGERDAARNAHAEVEARAKRAADYAKTLEQERDAARQAHKQAQEAADRVAQERDAARQAHKQAQEAVDRVAQERDAARQAHKQAQEAVDRVAQERDAARTAHKQVEQAARENSQALRRVEQERDRAISAQARSEDARAAAAEAMGRTQGELESARRQYHNAERRAENWRDKAQGLRVEIDRAQREIDRVHADFESLQTAVAGYKQHSDALHNELVRTQGDYSTADAERLALRIERDRISARLQQIEASTTWRASAVLRSGLGKAPWLAAGIRRALKATWWTVTGQLARRLRERREALIASQTDDGEASTPNRPPMDSLRPFLETEFGASADADIEALIKRYDLAFQTEGQPPIKKTTDAKTARDWAKRLSKLAAERGLGDDTAPDVSIIIPAYNQIAYTLACIESVLISPSTRSFEILVGDDQSTDGTQAAAKVSIPSVRWVRHAENQGFVGNCNLTAAKARGCYVVFLNNDTLVLPGWLDALVDTLESDAEIGLAGSKLIYPDGRLQEAGGIFWQDGSAWNLGRFDNPRRPEFSYARDVDYISGASIALPRDLWEQLDGFDDLYRPAYAEDADLAFRIRAAGFRTVFQPRSMLLHFEGVSSGTDLGSGAKAYQVTNLERLRERWADVLADHRPNAERPDLEKERSVQRRALFIDITTPEPQHDAGSLVAVETMRALQALGYKVTFVPQDNFLWTEAFSAPLQAMGVEVIYHPFYSRFPQFIEARGSEFDLVFVHRFAAAERTLADLRAHAPQARIAFMPADLHFLREGREAELSGDPERAGAAAETRRRELAVIQAADAVLPHSTLELELLASEAPETPAFHLPLIHDPEPTPAAFGDRAEVGFIGGYGHPPNVDAVDWFLESIWPQVRAAQPDARFLLAGSKMPDRFKALHGRDGVEILGFVETLSEFFDGVKITVAPLRYGAGAKGKVAASLAMGVPCVSTSIGEEGMGLSAGNDLLVADEPQAFAEAVADLISNESRWNELREAGLAFAERATSRAVVRRQVQTMITALGDTPAEESETALSAE